LINALPQLVGQPLQVIHLTGKQDEQLMRDSYAQAGVKARGRVSPHMEQAYSAADFTIARSGAASLTELSHFALPGILIPYRSRGGPSNFQCENL